MTDFALLSRRAQLRRLRTAAVLALADYGCHDPTLRLINHDFNATYRVDSDAGRFALRINTNSPHALDAITAEATWIDAIARDTDLTVPTPQRTADGALTTTVPIDGLEGDRGAVLYSWLDGPDLGEETSLRRLGEVGRAMATLHTHAETWTGAGGLARPEMRDVFMDETNRITDHPRISDAHQAVLAAAQGEMERLLGPVFAGPRLLIHADLHVWNTKWVDGRLAVFDFDDCGYGVALQDLAITAYYVHDRSGSRDAILDGYAALRPVPDHTPEQFEALVASRNLLLLNSVLPNVTAGMDDFVPGFIERTAARLQGWLETGRFEM